MKRYFNEKILRQIDEVSRILGKPYFSESMTRFLFEKQSCYHEITVTRNHSFHHIWVDSGTLNLTLEKLAIFCNRIEEVSNRNQTSLRIEISNVTNGVFTVYTSGRFGFDDFRDSILAIKNNQQALFETKKVIDEFKIYDKTFDSLEALWERVVSSENKIEKGKKLEELLNLLISVDGNFDILPNKRTNSEEIDLVIQNKGRNSFYSQLASPIILIECKNWASKIGSKVIRDFAQKIQNRPRMLCKIGVLVTISPLTKDAKEELVGYRGKEFLIVEVSKEDISKIIAKRNTFTSMLENKIKENGLR